MQQHPLSATEQVERNPSAQPAGGFTLLELLTVVVCIGILVALILILRH